MEAVLEELQRGEVKGSDSCLSPQGCVTAGLCHRGHPRPALPSTADKQPGTAGGSGRHWELCGAALGCRVWGASPGLGCQV